MLTAAENALSNHGLPKRREAWIKVLSWLTKKTYKVIMLTCIMLVWERYGECSAIPGVEGTEQWVGWVLQLVAMLWYFVPRFKLRQRFAAALPAAGAREGKTMHVE